MSTNPETLFRFGQPRPDEILKLNAALECAAAGAEGAGAAAAAEMVEAIEAAELNFARYSYKTPPPPPGDPPYRMKLADLIGQDRVHAIEAHGTFIIHAVGDTGQHGNGAAAQDSIAYHMERQVNDPGVGELDKPCLFYHLGDVIYYSGELYHYPEQFYDPYAHYMRPIVAIPGNHDGNNVPTERSLESFVRNFCTPAPVRPPQPGLSQRLTMTQPNYYFTFEAPFVTLIGLYSNTTGDLDNPNGSETTQYDWLVGELQAADPGKFLVVAVHHPSFSADTSHGGEKRIGRALDAAFAEAGRLPHMVLSGHVHNYQRFSRQQSAGNALPGRNIPYIVAGAGGYAGYDSLNRVNKTAPMPHGVVLESGNGDLPTFLVLTATATSLICDCYTVPAPPNHTRPNYPAHLFDSVSVNL